MVSKAYLLRLVVRGVGGMASLAVAVMALDDVIVLGLLNHDHLVDAAFASGSNRADVQGYLIGAAALTGKPEVKGSMYEHDWLLIILIK